MHHRVRMASRLGRSSAIPTCPSLQHGASPDSRPSPSRWTYTRPSNLPLHLFPASTLGDDRSTHPIQRTRSPTVQGVSHRELLVLTLRDTRRPSNSPGGRFSGSVSIPFRVVSGLCDSSSTMRSRSQTWPNMASTLPPPKHCGATRTTSRSRRARRTSRAGWSLEGSVIGPGRPS